MKSIFFWDVKPCGPLNVNQTFRKNISLTSSESKNKLGKKPDGKEILNVKSISICSSETSVDLPRTTWHYIPKYFSKNIFS
jgi:hypothetical protein